MRSRSGIALVCSLVAVASLAVAGPAGAATVKANAVGQIGCTMSGKVSYKPKLTTVAQPIVVTIKATLSCTTGISGYPGIAVTSGKLGGSSTPYVASCQHANPSSLGAGIKWKALGAKLGNTAIRFGAATGGANPISYTLRSVGVTGSYLAGSATAVISSSITPSACGGQGIRSWSFGGAPFTITGCGIANPTRLALGQYNGTTRPDDLHVWYVVQPAITYAPQCHPTGTMTLTFRNREACPSLTNIPVADSGSYGVYGYTNPYADVFGLVSPYVLLDEDRICGGFRNVSYSGDGIYQGFFVGTP